MMIPAIHSNSIAYYSTDIILFIRECEIRDFFFQFFLDFGPSRQPQRHRHTADRLVESVKKAITPANSLSLVADTGEKQNKKSTFFQNHLTCRFKR
jgi:hypothetical protein